MDAVRREITDLRLENERLQSKLAEAEDLLSAIRSGSIDSVIVSGPEGEKIYSLTGAEYPYRIMVESMGEGAVTLSSTGTILYSNRSFARAVRSPMQKIIGSMFTEYLDPQSKVRFENILKSKRKKSKLEVFLLASDSRIPVYLSVSPLKDSNSDLLSIVITDLTHQKNEELMRRHTLELQAEIAERKRAENDLTKSEERFRKIYENSRMGIVVGNLKGEIITSNPAFSFMLGYSQEELVGKSFEEFSVGDLDEEREKIKDLIKGNKDFYSIEKQYRRKDGSVITVLLHGSILDGIEPTGFAMIEDITERKNAENRIQQLLTSAQQEKDRLLTLINNMPDEVWCFDADGNIELVNPPVVKEFGTPLVNLKGAAKLNDGSEVYHLDGKPRQSAESPPLRALKGETIIGQEEIVRIPSSGELRIRQVNASPVKDADGKIVGAVAIVRDMTERKRAEEELKASEQRFRHYFESPHTGMSITSPDKGWVEVNDRICSLLGYSRDELASMTWSEITYPDDLASDVEQFNRILSGQIESYSLDKRFIRKGGEILWTNIAVGCVRNTNGTVKQIVASMLDINERKRAEEALIASHNELQSIIDGTTSIVYAFDLDNKFQLANKAVAELLQSTPEELIGKRRHEFMDKVTADWHEDNDRKVVEQGSAIELDEYGPLNKDGHSITWLTTKFPLRDSQGKIYAVAGISTDLSERKRAEEELAMTRMQLQGVMDNTPGLIYASDLQGRLMLGNKALADLLGVPSDQLIGRRRHEFMLKHIADRDEAHDRQVIASGVPLQFDEPGEFNGKLISYLTTKFPLRNAKGITYGVAGVSLDITERKQAEEALQKAKDELETRVNERTSELYAANLYTRSLIETNIDPLVTISAEGKITDVNLASEEATGITREQLIKSDFSDYFTEPEKARAGYKEVFRKGIVRDYPLELKHKDGHSIPVLYNATLYRDENGQIRGVFAAARDITKRKQAEEALKKSEEAYRLLVELNPIGVFRHVYNPVTKEQKRLHCNEAQLRILGYSSLYEYLKNVPTETMRNKSDWDKYLEYLLTDGKVINYPVQMRKQDGTIIWVLLNASARRHNGGILVEGAMTDITQQKKIEERLRRAQKNLRAMASEIVMTDERSRQHFATDLHDTVVQTLGAAKLRSQLIQDKIPGDANPIYKEMQDFISQSITQARMIMAEMSPPVLYELGFIPALEWLVEQIASQHDISIDFRAKQIPPLVHDIQVLLFQATRELLMNVVKHAQAKTAVVKATVNGPLVRIEIRDHGKGFNSRKGFRTDVSGGGFGLFSIRERLKHFGGELHISSKSDRGTKVTMTVPRLLNGNS